MRSAGRDIGALHDYAVALLQARQPHDAIAPLIQALRIAPDRFDLLLALTQAHQLCGHAQDALACAEAATVACPGDPRGWFLRGRLEAIAGSNVAAEESLRRAVAGAPSTDEAWHYLGEVLQRQGRWDEAIQAYGHAMRSQPGEIMNIGICSERAGRWEDARNAYAGMCRLHPERRDCLTRLAQVAAMLCDFQLEARTTARLSALLEKDTAASDDYPEPFPLAYLPIVDQLRRKALRQYTRRISSRVSPMPRPARPDAAGRLRIGYLSADFGRHAVGTLLRGLFAAHDRSRFAVLGYSLKRHDDPVAAQLREEFDTFRDVERTPAADIATAIRRDRVDVLIDLAGYTAGARPEVLAMRPAALQLGWLGFIHGHEAPWLDGLVMDGHVQPGDAEWPYSDKVLRLPGLMFPCGPMPAGSPSRARFGLPSNVPLLASFNNSYKLDAELVDAWIEILRRAPTAHLAVYLPAQARPGFLQAWEQRGGESHRLHVLGHVDLDTQADRAASCDLFVDAFRYQAGATALASVAAGLPVLSRSGDSTLSRLGAGLNRFLGLDELACHDTAQYIERAAHLANHLDEVETLRSRMRDASIRRGLFDPRRAAAAIETLIHTLLGSSATGSREPER